jgi:hypothetical protein
MINDGMYVITLWESHNVCIMTNRGVIIIMTKVSNDEWWYDPLQPPQPHYSPINNSKKVKKVENNNNKCVCDDISNDVMWCNTEVIMICDNEVLNNNNDNVSNNDDNGRYDSLRPSNHFSTLNTKNLNYIKYIYI